jgi:hypothetical protein
VNIHVKDARIHEEMQANFYKYMQLDGSYQLIENGSVSSIKVSLPNYHQERI